MPKTARRQTSLVFGILSRKRERELAQRPRDELLQFRMNRAGGSDIFAALERTVGTAIIGHEAARFPDQQHARGGVPEVEVVLPEAVHPPRGDPCQIERRRSEPP